MSVATRLLKEPLVHFIAAGSVLFVVAGWLGESESADSTRQVLIGEGEVRWLTETWSRQRQRQPSRDELQDLIGELVREELLAREARELGLDKDDTIVRRRLAQKLMFLVEDTAQLQEPTSTELRRLYDAKPHLFQEEARVTLVHVFFDPGRRADAAGDARQALRKLMRLGAAADLAEFGDGSLVQSEFHDTDEQMLAAQLGPEFARAVFALQPGTWQGPVQSSYGAHLVRVTELNAGRRRGFEDVREALAERWHEERRREQAERYFDGLEEKYEVILDEGVKSLVGELPGKLAVAP